MVKFDSAMHNPKCGIDAPARASTGLYARLILANESFTAWAGSTVDAVGTAGGAYFETGFEKAYFFYSTRSAIGYSVFKQGQLEAARASDGATVAAPAVASWWWSNGVPALHLSVVGGDAASLWIKGVTTSAGWGAWEKVGGL